MTQALIPLSLAAITVMRVLAAIQTLVVTLVMRVRVVIQTQAVTRAQQVQTQQNR